MNAELINFIGLSFSIGFLSLLTPCVFPMIPITVSYFTKRSKTTHRSAILDSLIYISGIVLAFSLIGLTAAIFFGASQINEIAANPWVNLFISIVFILLALNLFGLFEIKLDHRLIHWFQKGEKEGGAVGILSMAVIFTLTTFTCTMPFVGTILVTASQGKILYPIIGMLCYGLSFSFPFFFLALFPKWMQSLPRSGDWMYTTKITMGFLELAAACKFLSNADMVWQFEWITRNTFLLIWAVILILLGFYFLKIIRFPMESKTKISPPRLVFGLAALLSSIHLIDARGGKTFNELEAFLPPPEYGNQNYISPFTWHDDLSEAKDKAAQNSQRLFIDFTGYTCINCRWMEQNLFVLNEVSSVLKKFILVRLYTDGEGEKYKQNQKYQQEKFNTVVLPFYVVLTPDEKILTTFEGMTRDKSRFVTFLKNGLSH